MTHEPTLTLEIIQDDGAENPYDQLGEIAHWHPHYTLGSKREVRLPRERTAIVDWLKSQDRTLMLPLYLLDHSGLSIRTAPFGDPWDSSHVGFIFTTLDRYKEMVESPPRRYWKAHARGLMTDEVKILNQYLAGDVWGYIVKDGDDVLDSCGGFYGHDEAEQEGNDALAYWQSKLGVTPDLPGLLIDRS